MIRIEALGGLRLKHNGEDSALPTQRRARVVLLTYLAAERDVTREHVMSVFWPESEAQKARHALNQSLYELRQAFGDDWLVAEGGGLRILQDVEFDAELFEGAAKNEDYDVAFQLYRGAFLSSVDRLPNSKSFESWLDARRTAYERTHRRLRRKHIAALVNNHDVEAALESARAWVNVNPQDDEAQHKLIELLSAAGRRSDATEQYAAYARALLIDDLEPLDETKALIAQIRSNGTSLRHSAFASAPATLAAHPDFELIRPLSEGSVARVFLAREHAINRLVAIKVLRKETMRDETLRLRFEREAQAAASVVHSNVVSVHRMGRLSSGELFIVLEYVQGKTLADRLIAEGPFNVGEVRSIFCTLAQALDSLHREGVVHRDVRPGNVLSESTSGRVVLMDFDLAALLQPNHDVPKLTRIGEAIGDVLHRSPEQSRGEATTPASDIYSLGVLAYELITGVVPGTQAWLLRDARADVDQAFSDVVQKCLSLVPAHRPEAKDLERLLGAP